MTLNLVQLFEIVQNLITIYADVSLEIKNCDFFILEDNYCVKNSQDPGFFDFSIIRDLRKEREMTLAELAEASGITSAGLSKLERNQTTAELETIIRIARVFGLSAAELLSLVESPVAQPKTADSYAKDAFSFHRIRYANHSCQIVEAECGARLNRTAPDCSVWETCWVLEGNLRVTLNRQPVDLTAGQSLHFNTAHDYSYEALEECVFFIVHICHSKQQ